MARHMKNCATSCLVLKFTFCALLKCFLRRREVFLFWNVTLSVYFLYLDSSFLFVKVVKATYARICLVIWCNVRA